MRPNLNMNNQDVEPANMDQLIGPPIINRQNDIEDLVLLDLDNVNDDRPLLLEEPVNPNAPAP